MIADEDKRVQQILDEGLNSKKILTKNFTFKKEKLKKDQKILSYVVDKYTAKGILYITKQCIKSDNGNKLQKQQGHDTSNDYKKLYNNFKEYFNKGVDIRNKFLESNPNVKNETNISNFLKNLENKESDMGTKKLFQGNKPNLQSLKSNTPENTMLKNKIPLPNQTKHKEKKSKMASTGKITNLKDINHQNEYLKTEYGITRNKGSNNILNQSDSEYEVEYIEKLKKINNTKIHEKPIDMSVWICDSFPIKISHFIPLIHILSFISTEFAELKSTLCSNFLPFQSFPMKISFPLGLSFYALLQVTSFTPKFKNYSIFDLNYENNDCTNSFLGSSPKNKNRKVSKSSKSNISEINRPKPEELNQDYAKDFYDKYYLEKKQEGDNSDFDKESYLQTEKIREIFFTNTEEVGEELEIIDTIKIETSSKFEQIKIFEEDLKDFNLNYSEKFPDTMRKIDLENLNIINNYQTNQSKHCNTMENNTEQNNKTMLNFNTFHNPLSNIPLPAIKNFNTNSSTNLINSGPHNHTFYNQIEANIGFFNCEFYFNEKYIESYRDSTVRKEINIENGADLNGENQQLEIDSSRNVAASTHNNVNNLNKTIIYQSNFNSKKTSGNNTSRKIPIPHPPPYDQSNNLALQEIKKFSNLKKSKINTNLISLDTNDLLDKEDEIPNEKDNFVNNKKENNFSLKVPFTPTPRRTEKIDYNSASFIRKESHEKSLFSSNNNYEHNDSDESQKTLKCTFKPKLMKNYKNFFKYKSNVENELQVQIAHLRKRNEEKSVKNFKKNGELKNEDRNIFNKSQSKSPNKIINPQSKSETSSVNNPTGKELCLIF
jgi:hypothetical protein